AIATTIFPQFSRWDAENAKNKIESIIPIAILPALLIVVPAFIGVAILSQDILKILFSAEFTMASLALVILTGEKIPQAIHIVLGRSLQAIDRPDLAAYATIISVLLNLVLNVAFIWQFGIAGAALATALSFVVNTILHAYYLNRYIDINFPVREALWSVFASIVMGIAVYIVRSVFKPTSIIDLLAIVILGGVTYAIIALIYTPIRSQVWELIGPEMSKRIP
ncbi:MAG: polysaccharide biosynthesis C-terminal domain-containing protein, partial [Halobacteriaceae archaeon]